MSHSYLVSWRSFSGGVLALLAVAVLAANAAHGALVIGPSSPTNARTGNYTIGYEFTVGSSPITLNALGVEDDASAALMSQHAVDVWSSTGTLLYSATVASGTSGLLSNGFRYAMLNSPITLSANTSYYIGAGFASGGDTFYDGSSTALFTPGPGITFTNTQGTYYAGASGPLTPNCPTTGGGGAAGRWAGANATEFGVVWTGSQSNVWSTAVLSPNKNWTSSGTASDYTDGSVVTFDDTAASGATTVNISQANVSPALVYFNNSANNYTLQGAYGISGSGGLNKSGSGLLTISNSNGFTGTTMISAGTVQLGSANALLNSTVSLGVSNGLRFVAGNTAATIGGLAGGGNLALQDGGNNPVTLTVGNNGASTNYSGVMSGSGGLVMAGTGTLTLSAVNTYSGATTIGAGTLAISGSGALNNTNLLRIGAGGTLDLSGNNNNELQQSGGTLSVSGILAVTTNTAHTLYPTTITLSGGTMTSSQSVAGYGAFYVGTSRTITASGGGNTISAVNMGIAGGQTLTLSTPLPTDTLSVSTALVGNSTIGVNGALAKSGSGAVVLTGTSTYTGATNVNAGTLYVNGSLSSGSPVAVASGAVLGGLGTVGPTTVSMGGILQGGYNGSGMLTLSSLTFSGAAAINVAPSTSQETLNVTGSNGLTTSGAASVAFNIGTTPLAAGIYPLVGYSGAVQGAGFGAFAMGVYPLDGNSYTLQNSSGTIDLNVALSDHWSGAYGTAWDTTTSNWRLGSDTAPATAYTNGLPVTFDDSAGTGTVTISGTNVSPANVVFMNNALAYTFQGNCGISGTTALTMSGPGLLTISNTNAFTGATTISGGTLLLANPASLPNSAVSVGVANGLVFALGTTASTIGGLSGTGSFALKDTGSNPVTLTVGNNGLATAYSGVMSGGGGLVKSGSGTLTLSSNNTYSGGTTVAGGTLALIGANNGSGAVRGNLAINAGAEVNADFSGTGWSLGWVSGNCVSPITINGGVLNFGSPAGGAGLSAASITLTGGTISGGNFDWYNGITSTPTLATSAAAATSVVSAPISLRLGGANYLTLAVAAGNAPNGTDLLVSGNITNNDGGSGGLVKTGPGTAVLTGANTYTGATGVNGGLLCVNGSLSASSTVSVAGGATLGGLGSVGPTTVSAGGIVQGGYNGPGTLTLKSLAFSTSGAINVAPSLSLAALNVTGSNALTASGGAGSVLVNIGSASLIAGTYPLIDYSGAIQGASGSGAFTLGTRPSDSNFYTLQGAAGAIDLFVALNAPYWSGANGAAWDTATCNWGLGSGNGQPSTYSNGLPVVFDDSAGTNGTVTISGADVSPASVTFNNSVLAYAFQGTNAIAGSTGLTKNGTALLTIANTNSFTGAVTINGGTVAVGSIAIGGVNSPLARARAWSSAAARWNTPAWTPRRRPTAASRWAWAAAGSKWTTRARCSPSAARSGV